MQIQGMWGGAGQTEFADGLEVGSLGGSREHIERGKNNNKERFFSELTQHPLLNNLFCALICQCLC